MKDNMEKEKKKKGKRKSKAKRVIKLTIQFTIIAVLSAIIVVIIYFYHAYGKTILTLQSNAKSLVKESSMESFQASQTSLVYDTDGNIISALRAEKDAYYIDYIDIPTPIVDAMVVTEDRKFLEHSGVDYWANLRAAISLIKNKGVIKQGASTITQQLARNVFLTHNVSYERKIEEIFIAQELEKNTISI